METVGKCGFYSAKTLNALGAVAVPMKGGLDQIVAILKPVTRFLRIDLPQPELTPRLVPELNRER